MGGGQNEVIFHILQISINKSTPPEKTAQEDPTGFSSVGFDWGSQGWLVCIRDKGVRPTQLTRKDGGRRRRVGRRSSRGPMRCLRAGGPVRGMTSCGQNKKTSDHYQKLVSIRFHPEDSCHKWKNMRNPLTKANAPTPPKLRLTNQREFLLSITAIEERTILIWKQTTLRAKA